MGGEDYEIFKVLRQEKAARGEKRRNIAEKQFDEAKRMAEAAGMILLRHTEAHYQLRKADWILNIYPGNRRLYPTPVPTLDVSTNWTLLDVITAVTQRVSIQSVQPSAMQPPVNRWSPDRMGVDLHQLAYKLWEEAGRPPGDGLEFWLAAEKQAKR